MAPAQLSATTTAIPGLLVVELPVHGDSRGWFKENWQREKMTVLGLPDFGPVQNNISFNGSVGTTRGIHAEPWDKFVSVASGRIFGAWVDLREGASFGAVYTLEIGPGQAVFVPYGVGNSYQTLEENTAYSYLVNDHWSPEASYTFLNLADETADIQWPIALDKCELSDKDRAHPRLADVQPMSRRKTLILGSSGQVGRALRREMPEAIFLTRAEFDITDKSSYTSLHWRDFDVVINASAYTKVDDAESEGRPEAWSANVAGVALLTATAAANGLTLVHISSDYVFDGTADIYREDDLPSPLGVYGQTKAAADATVSVLPNHYIVRTSWVIGDGNNFVRTMANLAARNIAPSVVDDQVGRLSFATDIAAGISYLLRSDAPFGTYNLTNDGSPQSWLDVAKAVYTITGHEASLVSGVSTAEYFAGKNAAPRPLNSVLDTSKIKAIGFTPRDAKVALTEYLQASSAH